MRKIASWRHPLQDSFEPRGAFIGINFSSVVPDFLPDVFLAGIGIETALVGDIKGF
jgi:hypothetical protein